MSANNNEEESNKIVRWLGILGLILAAFTGVVTQIPGVVDGVRTAWQSLFPAEVIATPPQGQIKTQILLNGIKVAVISDSLSSDHMKIINGVVSVLGGNPSEEPPQSLSNPIPAKERNRVLYRTIEYREQAIELTKKFNSANGIHTTMFRYGLMTSANFDAPNVAKYPIIVQTQ